MLLSDAVAAGQLELQIVEVEGEEVERGEGCDEELAALREAAVASIDVEEEGHVGLPGGGSASRGAFRGRLHRNLVVLPLLMVAVVVGLRRAVVEVRRKGEHLLVASGAGMHVQEGVVVGSRCDIAVGEGRSTQAEEAGHHCDSPAAAVVDHMPSVPVAEDTVVDNASADAVAEAGYGRVHGLEEDNKAHVDGAAEVYASGLEEPKGHKPVDTEAALWHKSAARSENGCMR